LNKFLVKGTVFRSLIIYIKTVFPLQTVFLEEKWYLTVVDQRLREVRNFKQKWSGADALRRRDHRQKKWIAKAYYQFKKKREYKNVEGSLLLNWSRRICLVYSSFENILSDNFQNQYRHLENPCFTGQYSRYATLAIDEEEQYHIKMNLLREITICTYLCQHRHMVANFFLSSNKCSKWYNLFTYLGSLEIRSTFYWCRPDFQLLLPICCLLRLFL
jgi:hypothetical protein